MEQEHSFGQHKPVEQLIFRDELTGVFNRRYLFQYLPHEIQRVKEQKQGLWLFMIDVDNFKRINDTHGHLCGDAVLKSVASILQRCVRTGDSVVRYAGDEFTLIVFAQEVKDVLTTADRILKAFSEFNFTSDDGHSIGGVQVSIGVAHYPDDADDAISLIDVADKALYTSKQAGKNRVSLAGDSTGKGFKGRDILERFPCNRLIERENQWQQLSSSLNAVASERRFELLAVVGSAGTGKTRLLSDFARVISANGTRVFSWRCEERYATQPFWAIAQALQQYLRFSSAAKGFFQGLSQDQLILMARILPDIKGIAPVGKAEVSLPEDEVQNQLQAAIVAAIKSSAERSTVCVSLDDIQFADQQTLEVMLGLSEKKYPLLMCCAFTKDETAGQGDLIYPFSQIKDSLLANSAQTLEMGPLSYNGTSEMIETILDMAPVQQFLNLVYSVTKGHPLFIEELLKFFIQKGFLYYHKGQWGAVEINEKDVPRSLHEVILERIHGLDKNAQDIIAKAAVIGQDFNVEVLRRMGKEDKARILDIIESAKKAGLIKKQISPHGEELSFVSDQIRKTLYDLLTSEKAKGLHQELGKIQEGLHAHDLDRVAGELFYHFKKAEDQHRAEQYAKRLKETHSATYDQAVRYAKDLLEGGTEKTITPVSKKSIQMIPEIVRLLYVMNLNSMLYPARSEVITMPLEQLFTRLTDIFTRDESLMFSEVKGALLINGEKPKDLTIKKNFEGSFIAFLKAHGIDSLSLRRGLTKAELTTFIELITKGGSEKTASELVQSKNLAHVEINDITYELVDKDRKAKERNKLEESMLIDYLLGKITGDEGERREGPSRSRADRPREILDAIDRVGEMSGIQGEARQAAQADVIAKTIQKVGSEIGANLQGGWQQQKKDLAKSILNLDPQLRKDVLLSEKYSVVGERNMLKELIPEFPDDDVVIDLLTDQYSTAEPGIAHLKSLLDRFLADPEQRKRIAPQLKERFQHIGLAPDESDWVFGERTWKEVGLDKRLQRFLEMSVHDYLNLSEEINIRELISESIAQRRDDIIPKILDKWAGFLQAADFDARSKIAHTTHALMAALPPFKHEALAALSEMLGRRINEEAEIEISAALMDVIAGRAAQLLERKDFIPAKIIIHAVTAVSSSAPTVRHQRLFLDFKEGLADARILKVVIDELIKRVDENAYYNDILELIFELGDTAADLLIEEAMIEDQLLSSIGYFGAFLRRRTIGEIITRLMQRLGRDVIVRGLTARLSSSKPYIVKNTMELFMYIHDQHLVCHLEPIVIHSDPGIRTKLVFVLGRLPGSDSVKLLVRMLSDKDSTVCLHAIRVLAKMGDERAIDALGHCDGEPHIREEAQRAIEQIRDRLKNR